MRIDNQPLTKDSKGATAQIDNFENCVVPGITECQCLRVCITDDQAKNATFKFEVELSAAYNQEQVYYYELDANRKVDGYEVRAIDIVYGMMEKVSRFRLLMLVSRARLLCLLVWAGSMCLRPILFVQRIG